jgi:hypothetical protein
LELPVQIIRTSFVAFLLILVAVAPVPAGAIVPPQIVMDGWLKLYLQLGLPLPPKDAKLVLYKDISPVDRGIASRSRHDVLAFVSKTKSGEADVFCFFRTVERGHLEMSSIPGEENPRAKLVTRRISGLDGCFVLAIQCHARGWSSLTQALLAKSKKEAGKSLKERLIKIAWDYWTDQLTEPKTDRRAILLRLRNLVTRDASLDCTDNNELLKSLSLTLVPTNSQPGSIEALIDALIDFRENQLSDLRNSHASEWASGDGCYWELAERGFEAVPELIGHLNDDRLTRAIKPAEGEIPAWRVRVRHVVSDILAGLAGSEISRRSFTSPEGYGIEKAKALRWWLRARNAGEEEYLVKRVLRNETDEKELVRSYLARILLAKYPKYAPAVSGAEADRRLRLRFDAKESWWRAFEALARTDSKQFRTFLGDQIQQIPQYTSDVYCECTDLRYVKLAMDTNDHRVWEALEQTAKRVELGVCMEFMSCVGDVRESRLRRERLAFLSSFLEDARLRDKASNSYQYGGSCAGALYPKIEVRDFAAIQLAGILGVELALMPDRSSGDWQRLRVRVREVLERERGR